MKICMIADSSISHDPRVIGQARALQQAGHEVTVIGLWSEGYAKEEYWENVRFLRYPRFWKWVSLLYALYTKLGKLMLRKRKDGSAQTQNSRGSPPEEKKRRRNAHGEWILPAIWNALCYFGHGSSVLRTVTAGGFDVIHAHDLNTLQLAWRCVKKTGTRLVYDSHELWLDLLRNKVGAPKFWLSQWEKTERMVAPKADLVITVCDGIAHILQDTYGLKDLPLVLYNCADLHPYQKSNMLREKYLKTLENRSIVLYQGGITPGKGLEEYCEMARRVPEADFVIVGPSREVGFQMKLENLSRDLANLFILEFIPYDKLWTITCGADVGYVCIQPICESYRLSLANKLFEYMAAGIAILASDLPGHRELEAKIDAKENPITHIPHDDPVKAADILKELLSDKERLALKGKMAYKLAESRFNRQREMSKLVDAYARFEKE